MTTEAGRQPAIHCDAGYKNSNCVVICHQIENMYKNVHAAIRENPEAETKPEKPEGQVKKKRYAAIITVSFLFV